MAKINPKARKSGASGEGKATFWDISDPGSAAKAASAVYGSRAVTAAAHCALAAHFDGRADDYRFWCTVFRELEGG